MFASCALNRSQIFPQILAKTRQRAACMPCASQTDAIDYKQEALVSQPEYLAEEIDVSRQCACIVSVRVFRTVENQIIVGSLIVQ